MSSDSPTPRWFSHRDLAARHEYAHRFTDIAARGEDVDGEARFVDAMASRGAAVLDAGCGTGRIAARLVRLGHRAEGIDVDPVLIDAGREQHPEVPLAVADLALATPESLSGAGLLAAYDLIVCAGNVMLFVGEGTEQRIVTNLAGLLVPGGRVAFGFLTGRGFSHDQLDEYAAATGLRREHRFADWEMRSFHNDADWAVSVYARPVSGSGARR